MTPKLGEARAAMSEALVGADGFAQRLSITSPLERVDIANARIRSGPFTLPPALARTRLKEWQHFLIDSPDVLVTTAIVDAKVLQVGWVQVVDKRTGARYEHHHQRPLADIALASALWDERCHFRSSRIGLEIHNHLSAGHHLVEIEAPACDGLPAVRGSARCLHDLAAIEPLVVSMKVGDQRFAYSHKVALPVEGSLTCGENTYAFNATNTVAVLDVHKAHYPRHTFWQWATTAGYLNGQLVGFNLTKNVAEDERIDHENAAWIDGKVHLLGSAVFERLGSEPDSNWSVRSADGSVDLTFTPEGRRSDNTNVPGVVRSRFDQFYGRFSGTIQAAGETHELSDFWGLCEDHDSVW